MLQTILGCMTWQEMFGNGVQICIIMTTAKLLMQIKLLKIRKDLLPVTTRWNRMPEKGLFEVVHFYVTILIVQDTGLRPG